MGTPTSIQSYSFFSQWYYGTSYIEFDENNIVKGYHTGNTALYVYMGDVKDGRTFSLGASAAEPISTFGFFFFAAIGTFGTSWAAA
jgi:hypothetical protein